MPYLIQPSLLTGQKTMFLGENLGVLYTGNFQLLGQLKLFSDICNSK